MTRKEKPHDTRKTWKNIFRLDFTGYFLVTIEAEKINNQEKNKQTNKKTVTKKQKQ